MGRPSIEQHLQHAALSTPAFVYDTGTLAEDTAIARAAIQDDHSRLLFALKSFSIPDGLRHIAAGVDGFAASSLFEARLARRVMTPGQTLHITSPGLRPDEIDAVCDTVDYITFNSLPQWQRYRATARDRVQCGLRINPQLSFVQDARYDPCRAHSKLGLPLDQLSRLLRDAPDELAGIRGLHVHSNCDSEDLAPLLQTVERLLQELDPLFDRIEWINLGGGYLFDTPHNQPALAQARQRLAARGDFRLFFEPGASIARRAGYLVASVVDLFDSGGRQIAVLDTSVNHLPEVFEYQFVPDVIGDCEDGEYEYTLAGSACLAGDLFGDYGFRAPLAVGSRVIFPDIGAYSMVKANWFNGINLPTLYALDEDGELREIRRFDFDDFQHMSGE